MGISTPQFFGAQTTSSSRILGDPYNKERFGRYFEQRQIAIDLLTAVTSTRASTRTVLGYPSDGTVYGADVATDGDFSNPSSWATTAGHTISGGKLIFDGVTASLGGANQGGMTVGDLYRVTYTIDSVSFGTPQFYAGNTGGIKRSAPGTYSEYLTPTVTGTLRMYNGATATDAVIDIVTVEPVNDQTLLTVPALLPAFEGGRLATTVADGAVLGSESVINGNFTSWTADNPNNWIVNEVGDATSNVTESVGGKCQIISDGTSTGISQNSIMTAGLTYQIIVDVVVNSGSGVIVRDFAQTGNYLIIATTGTYTLDVVSNDQGIYIIRGGATDTVINSISIKQVTPTWLDTDADGVALTDVALSNADSTINKCTCVKANPVAGDESVFILSGDASATLTIVDDSAELASAGLSEICTSGKVYKLDNSSGVGFASVAGAGLTGNTNKHSFAAYGRKTGVLNASINLPPNSTGHTIAVDGGGYELISDEDITPSSNFNSMSFVASAGNIVYFILPGLYESATVPSSAPTIGDDTAAAASSAADVNSIPTPSVITPEQGAIEWRGTADEAPQVNKYLLSLAVGDVCGFFLAASGVRMYNNAAYSSSSYIPVAGDEFIARGIWDKDLGIGVKAALVADIDTVPFVFNAAATTDMVIDATTDVAHKGGTSLYKCSIPQKGITFYKSVEDAGWLP